MLSNKIFFKHLNKKIFTRDPQTFSIDENGFRSYLYQLKEFPQIKKLGNTALKNVN
jgi:exopolysaccharide biosynthesis predicted pyruvyltransferase EpsI